MPRPDSKERAAGECDHCGTIHAVHVWPDGSIRPIGADEECECGNGQWRIVDDGPAEE